MSASMRIRADRNNTALDTKQTATVWNVTLRLDGTISNGRDTSTQWLNSERSGMSWSMYSDVLPADNSQNVGAKFRSRPSTNNTWHDNDTNKAARRTTQVKTSASHVDTRYSNFFIVPPRCLQS